MSNNFIQKFKPKNKKKICIKGSEKQLTLLTTNVSIHFIHIISDNECSLGEDNVDEYRYHHVCFLNHQDMIVVIFMDLGEQQELDFLNIVN